MIEIIQIALERIESIPTVLSIILAIGVFWWQVRANRKSRRQSEMWGYFKRVADRISDFMIKFDSEARKLESLLYEILKDTEQSNENIKDTFSGVSKRTTKALEISRDIHAYLLYNARPEVESLLHYYKLQTKRDNILRGINNATEETGKCIEQMEDFQGTFKMALGVLEGNERYKSMLDEFIRDILGEDPAAMEQSGKLNKLVESQINALRSLIAPARDSNHKEKLKEQANNAKPNSGDKEEVVFIAQTLQKLRQNLLKEIK